MIADAALPVALDQIRGGDDVTEHDLQTRLLFDLSSRRFSHCLTKALGAARQTPLAHARWLAAAHQEDALAVPNHDADANDWAVRIFAAHRRSRRRQERGHAAVSPLLVTSASGPLAC